MSTPPPRIRRDTRVFISAVTRELGSVRDLVKKGLEDNDYHAVEQDNFPPDYRDLIDKLRERIDSCDAVVHIAGLGYGAEPPQRPPDAPRRSYTQLEYDIAVELGKPVYVFLTGDGFPADPREPESPELRELQKAHREHLTSTGRDYNPTSTAEQLDQKVRSLRLKVERLEEELQQVDQKVAVAGKRLGGRLVLVAILVAAALGAVGFVILQQRAAQRVLKEARAKQEIEQRAQEEERAKQERERIAAEAARQEARTTKQVQLEIAEGLLQELLADKNVTAEEARRRAIARLASVRLSPAEIESLINRKIPPPAARMAPSPVDTARAALARGDLDEVLKEADKEKKQGRELAMLEGTAALAKFRGSPKPEWNLRALAAFQRAMALADPNSAAEWETWTDAAVSAASVLHDLARYAEAEPLLRHCQRLRESKSAPNSPRIAEVLDNLATLLRATNRMAEAEPLFRRALAIFERSLGPEHPNVATDLNNLAELLRATNRMVEAEPLFRRALLIDEWSLGPKYPNVARDLSNLALLLKATNRITEAEPLYRRALAIDERALGPKHPEVARAVNNLAALLQATNRVAEAEPLCRRALVIDEQSFGPEHPNVAIRLNNLAVLLQATNRMAEAEPLMAGTVRILSLFQRLTGHEHPQLRTATSNYRQLLVLQKRTEPEIEARIKTASEGTGKLAPVVPDVERLLGPAKPVADVLSSLDRQYKEQGKPAVYFLGSNELIASHLDELLRPKVDGLNALGLTAFRGGAHADAVVLYETALELMAEQPAQVAARLRTRMNRAAALRELGLIGQARDELSKLLPELEKTPAADPLTIGRARYHLALCRWRLGERVAAQKSAEESLAAYDGAPKAESAVRRASRGFEGRQVPPAARRDRRACRDRGGPRPVSSPRGPDEARAQGGVRSLAGPNPRPGQTHERGLRRARPAVP
jgi:tetratricopeptide (TPR) repeat protein